MSYNAIYAEAVRNGCSDRLADMLASRKPPGIDGTDTRYFAKQGTLADQFKGNEGQLHYIVEQARSMGYEPNMNDVYEPSLAECIGDPKAFVSPSGGLSHIRNVADERDYTVHGVIERKRDFRGLDKVDDKPHLAEDIVDRYEATMVMEGMVDPGTSRREVREMIRAEYTPEF